LGTDCNESDFFHNFASSKLKNQLMNNYQKLNNIIGWVVCAFASLVYILTSEPTTSFWDCGEYISTSYKLMVGHPPGAPLFQLMGRFFSLFAFGDVSLVARMVNTMSALVSGFTILFLFWSITHFAKKIALRLGEMTDAKMYAILGSGLVGALAYTFTDSFWFSAVEGEVYATSSFFTAVVFWAMLKWEDAAEKSSSVKWIILIAYLIGLSIGVHLLNLLTVPAMVFIFYFKKYKPSAKGIIVAFIVSILLVGGILKVIIPWVVVFAGRFELFFVNNMGMPFNSGTIIYFIILIGLLIFGIYITQKKKKLIWNTIILSFTFMLIGYSSFMMLVIRSNANTPINENCPKSAVGLLSYLNREQYGETPLFSGPYYNAPVIDFKDGSPVYTQNEKLGKYVITDHRYGSEPVYEPRYTTLFPRMWSSDDELGHPQSYKTWAGIPKSKPDSYVPTFGENLSYLFNYQVGHMYVRYFMWNFVGRQNDRQGMGGPIDGNWLSGVKWIDEMRLGPQDNIPANLKNKATNKFYFLPFLLGLIGLYFQINKFSKDSLVVGLLFFFTGLAILFYLNQPPNQPRERDYAYAGSFYAFAIWIGIGVMAIYHYLSSMKFARKIKQSYVAISTTVLCLLLVPFIMANQGWDDHDRSNRYTALDFATDYLNSCAPNAILFTNGDNDTFPLWYAQEVEGIRTDVRVVNLSLLNTDWYADQMKQKVYNSEPVPFSMTIDQFRQGGSRDIVYYYEDTTLVPKNKFEDIKNIIQFIASDDPSTKYTIPRGKHNADVSIFPTRNFYISVDTLKVIKNGTLSKDIVKYVTPKVQWTLNKTAIYKNNLLVLDLLAHFNWDRPVYFATSSGPSTYLGLQKYLSLEGLAYRLVPANLPSNDIVEGYINTEVMYDNMMNKFKFGNIDKAENYFDEETNLNMARNLRNSFARLALALVKEGKKDSAVKVLNRCLEVIPVSTVSLNEYSLLLPEALYRAGATDKANEIAGSMITSFEQLCAYYFSFTGKDAKMIEEQQQVSLEVVYRLFQMAQTYKQDALAKRAEQILNNYSKFLQP
jgi:hypothetical protein